MDWEMSARRQAVTEWRDRQILAVSNLINMKAVEAQKAFDLQLGDAGLYDSVWAPAGFADARIDGELRELVPPALATFFANAAGELFAIDPRLQALSDALRSGDGIVFPRQVASPEPENPTSTKEPPIDERWAITRVAGKMASTVIDAGRAGAETIADALQDGAGLRERVRNAASDRIAKQWMGLTEGSNATEPPVLLQAIMTLDEITNNARASLL